MATQGLLHLHLGLLPGSVCQDIQRVPDTAGDLENHQRVSGDGPQHTEPSTLWAVHTTAKASLWPHRMLDVQQNTAKSQG